MTERNVYAAATRIEMVVARTKPTSASSSAKFATNWSDGSNSMWGLKMPFSAMVEKTNIIQSGNSQSSASGASTACSAILRCVSADDLLQLRRSRPSQRLRSEMATAIAAMV